LIIIYHFIDYEFLIDILIVAFLRISFIGREKERSLWRGECRDFEII
jgi:hypothetical protein